MMHLLMDNNIKPNDAEKEFLLLAYNKFYDIYDEINKDDFWKKDSYYRYARIKDAFLIYGELLHYPPFKFVFELIEKNRPPFEAEIGNDLFRVIRNILAHFPYFEKWDETWITKKLVNWYKKGQFIDKFLCKYEDREEFKFRYWMPDKKKMVYLSIKFPKNYSSNEKVYLRDFLPEKDGVTFVIRYMRKILDTQVEKST